MTTIQEFINFFDYFGSKPQLYYLSKSRYTSSIGAVTSILALISISALIIYFFISFLLCEGMTIVFSKDNLKTNQSYSIGENVFMIRMHDLMGKEVDSRIATIKAVHWKYEKTNTTITHIPMEECSYETTISQEEKEELIGERQLSIYKCLTKLNNATISISSNNLSGSYLYFYLVKCNNETDNDICLPQIDIDSYLSKNTLYIAMFYESIVIDHYNLSHPIRPNLIVGNQLISTSLNYDMTLFWKAVDYYTDVGWIFSSFTHLNHFEYDDTFTKLLIHITPERYYLKGTFSSIKIALDPYSVEIYHRTFPKIQSVIANIGGFLKIILLFGDILVSLLIKGRYYVDLMRCNSHILNTNNLNLINNSNSVHSNDELSRKIKSLKSGRSFNSIKKVLTKSIAINPLNSFQWMLCPKLNLKTQYICLCEKNISKVLSVENIIQKLYSLDNYYDTNNIQKNQLPLVNSPMSMKINKKRIPLQPAIQQRSLFYQSMDLMNDNQCISIKYKE